MKAFVGTLFAAAVSAEFDWTVISAPARNVISGIILKERSELAKCRETNKGSKCFDDVKKCMNA